MNKIAVALFILLLAPVLVAADKPVADKPRQSADGEPYPPANEKRKFQGDIPYAKNWLGAKPEEIPARWLSPTKSPKAANGRPLLEPFDFFAVNFQGYDIVGITLEAGVICRVQFALKAGGPQKVEAIGKELIKEKALWNEWWGDLYIISNAGTRYSYRLWGDGTRVYVTVWIHQTDWYLAQNKVPENVAKAIKESRVEKGMTLDQVVASLGNKPDKTTARANYTTHQWIRSTLTPTGQWQTSRTVDADFANDVVIDFREEKVNR